MKIGDKVQYNRRFLRSISALTGELPFAKGTVTGLKDYGPTILADVSWDNPEAAGRVNVKNLEILFKS